MKPTVEILRDAKALIANPANWITGEYARALDGRRVPPSHNEACLFCAIGALAHVAESSAQYVECDAEFMPGVFLNKAASETDKSPDTVNDSDGHAAVMALYDRAIALAEQTP